MSDEQKSYPLVTVITVNYNQLDVTCDLLATLRKVTYPNVEVIVVDNASPTENPDVIKERYPEIKLIKSNENLGFAGGNNLGIKVAKGAYLFFLNNDTEVPENVMEPLVDFLQSTPDAGMVCPKIKYHEAPDLIQFAGYTAMNKWTIRNSGIGYKEKDLGQHDTIATTEYAHGAAMMLPKNVVDEVGLMPELYFLYYEELDWAEMVKRAGYKLYYQPATFVLHKDSVSTGGEDSPMKVYYLTRNRLLFARRNFGGLPLVFSTLFFLGAAFPKALAKYLVKGQMKHLSSLIKGTCWNLTHSKQ